MRILEMPGFPALLADLPGLCFSPVRRVCGEVRGNMGGEGEGEEGGAMIPWDQGTGLG